MIGFMRQGQSVPPSYLYFLPHDHPLPPGLSLEYVILCRRLHAISESGVGHFGLIPVALTLYFILPPPLVPVGLILEGYEVLFTRIGVMGTLKGR